MSEPRIDSKPPVRFTEGGFALDFVVEREGEARRVVVVKFSTRAWQVFVGVLKTDDLDLTLVEPIMGNWGNEKIAVWLGASRQLPESLSLQAGPAEDLTVDSVSASDARDMLAEWGMMPPS